MAEKVIAEISADHSLKHVETTDKSAPKIESDVHLKKIDRGGFLDEVQKGAELKHAETTDKSVPKIEPDVHLKKNNRDALLNEIKKADS